LNEKAKKKYEIQLTKLPENERPISADVRKQFQNEIGRDTVAVLVDGNNDITVAANIKTRNLKTTGNKKVSAFTSDDLGLNDNDVKTVVEKIREDPRFKGSSITVITTKEKPTTVEMNAAPHAEMQLLHNLLNEAPRGETQSSVLAASKAPCGHCADSLSVNDLLDPNAPLGYPKDKVKNWDPYPLIEIYATTVGPNDVPNSSGSYGVCLNSFINTHLYLVVFLY